jgi:cysteine-rich repeat protein
VPKRVYPKPAPGNPRNQPTWRVDPLLEIQERGSTTRQQVTSGRGQISAPNVNETGLPFTGAYPPDTVGDVGPTVYIQAVNGAGGTVIQGYNKTGGLEFGPTVLDTIGFGVCANGLGDPIVLHDRAADRWLLAEFSAVANALCVYVSQTSDPGGAYFAYGFVTPNFPDYPKFAVWSDSYLVTTNESGPSPVYAMDRSQMLIGGAATMQRFTAPDLGGFGFQALTPADLDGAILPPLGTPGYFVRHRDDEVHNPGSNDPGGDFLEIWELSVDHAVPANSTFTGPTNIAITEIDSELCGLFSFNCFPQPNGQRLDPLREVVMWRLQYRNFGSHETLVGNLTTDVSGTDRGGIRWFELRNSGSGWALFQEGTYSPDTDNRWMGSIAMDQAGNMALGYSVVSPTQFTDIRYTGREAGDPAGTLPQGEFTIAAGAGSQTVERWGDYSAMSVDPGDDCTFWYTNEFVLASGNWDTQIASLKFDSCPTLCGDGSVAGPEACDDGNTVDGDGCSSSCQIEPGFACTGQPSVCAPDQGETCYSEDFNDISDWTLFNTGPLAWDWGTTNDGVCWSNNLGGPPVPNVTGGSGVGACIDSDAAASAGLINAYMCSQAFPAGEGAVDLGLLFNYQIFGTADADDFFSVLVGTATPNAATIGSYTTVFSTSENAGSFAALPGSDLTVDLTSFAGANIHVCLGYGGEFDWYAQVDDVTVVAENGCGTAPDTDQDGVPDTIDNCIDDPNPLQENFDGDLEGDACDLDDDNDGQSDADEVACGSNPLDDASLSPDANGNGVPDCVEVDSDNDFVADTDDMCPGTVIPESVPTSSRGLGSNRWTLDNPDGSFTQGPPQSGRTLSYSTTDTRGCSCEQIIAELGLGEGHSKFGCSNSAMMDWVNLQ